MKKISIHTMIRQIAQSSKTYFTLADFQKYYPGGTPSLKVLLTRAVHEGHLYRLGRGYYASSLTRVNPLQLAHAIDPRSYVSFEYALFSHGLTDQVPSVITLATKSRHRVVTMGTWTFEYTALRPDLCFGYTLKKRALIAAPEKALADTLYVIARGKRLSDLSSLNTDRIDRAKFIATLKRFPQSTRKKAEEFRFL